MGKYTYYVVEETYDWFTGNRREVKGFTTLVEAWSFYKSNSKFDFDYGDHYQNTKKPWRAKDADAYILPNQRPHARSKSEYEKWFTPYKCEPFFSHNFDDIKDVENFDDIKDVEVVKKEEEYFFDNGELLF